MARDLSGASQRIVRSSGSTGLTDNPVTMFIYARRNSTTTEGYACGMGSNGTTNACIGMRGDTGGDPIQARLARFGAIGVNAGTYSADTWTGCTMVVRGTGASDIESWKDGTKVTGSNAGVGWNPGLDSTVSLGAFADGSVFLVGMVAQFAAWSAALTADEIGSLVAGFSPRRIRPQSLVVYTPNIRTTADLTGRITAWTEHGSPGVFPHPRMYGL